MKIVEINVVFNGSTGKIMIQTAKCAQTNGHNVFCFSKNWKNNKKINNHTKYIGTRFENVLARIFNPLFSSETLFTYISTKRFLKQIHKIKPNIIHLHNIHGWYIDYNLLFKYIKKNDIPVIWTLHDCWSFTGHCTHFANNDCFKWETLCSNCKYLKTYPKLLFDTSTKLWKKKKKSFSNVNNMVIVTPSIWLSNYVKDSFLNNYDVMVINNGIDLQIFKPTILDNYNKYNIAKDKKVLLGVSFAWGYLKGLDVMIELNKIIDHNEYQIVLVGTSDEIDKMLPDDIVSIHKTDNQKELAKIYSSSYVLVNPTRADTYSSINMEALACGTPVITFNTGGAVEMIDSLIGIVTKEKNAISIYQELDNVSKIDRNVCIKKAKLFDMNTKFEEYVNLYERIGK